MLIGLIMVLFITPTFAKPDWFAGAEHQLQGNLKTLEQLSYILELEEQKATDGDVNQIDCPKINDSKDITPENLKHCAILKKDYLHVSVKRHCGDLKIKTGVDHCLKELKGTTVD